MERETVEEAIIEEGDDNEGWLPDNDKFYTLTMAEILERQGLKRDAIKIYQVLLKKGGHDMGFLEILKELVDKAPGGVAGTIMAKDGIAIQNYIKGSAAYDMDALGVEYARILSEAKNASSMLALGNVEEMSVSAEGSMIVMRLINQDYFMAIVLGPGENLGKARYLLKRAVASVRKEF
ncbi:MAG: hypothetical protein HY026_02270 [Deltaproteobacteria bacterium]|nr:hypothetical protein [Deltaproteobacteria bacterium]